MRTFQELRETNNSFVYNRQRKQTLENTGKIRCTYCPYHRNQDNFDGYEGKNPSWKLMSKSKHQWKLDPDEIIPELERARQGYVWEWGGYSRKKE